MDTEASSLDANHRQLQQLVTGLIEGIMLLDKRRHITWSNASALKMHGCETPEALGETISAYTKHFQLHYLNRHALEEDQYPLARAAAGESFSGVRIEVTHRAAGHEDFRRVHEARSVMLTDARGNTESIAVVIQDVTDEIVAEERFERAFAANPAPAVIYRPADNTYIKVNRGFLIMTGFESDEIVGKRLDEIDVLQGASQRDQILIDMQENRSIAQQESSFSVKSGDIKSVIVAGQAIEVGNDTCMLLTFIDLDERKRAELALRESEERFSKAFQLAPVPMLMCEQPSWRITMANAAFNAVTGTDQETVIGQTVAAIGLWKDARALSVLRGSLEEGKSVRNREASVRGAEGVTLDCLISAEPVMIGDQAHVLCAIQDITDRKRSEMEFVAAIDAVMKDTSWFTTTIMEKLALMRDPSASTLKSELSALTLRERGVLTLICQGKSNAEIAEKLQLSHNTVRNHVATIYEKIGVHRRSAAVVWGRERGLAGY